MAESTRTSFYPGLALTGSAGSASDQLLSVLRNPVGTLAAAIAAPLFNGNARYATNAAAQASAEQASVQFAQNFYQGLRDVEDALASRDSAMQQDVALRRSADLASDSAQRTRVAYQAGALSLQAVIEADLTARAAVAQWRAERYLAFNNQMALFQALGGSAEAC